MRSSLLIIVLVFFNTAFGQMEMAEIQTSAECGDCKSRIEDRLNYTRGVKFAELDLETKKVLVKFNTKKISLSEIKTIISETGYAADEVNAVPTAVEKFPACCKPGGMKK